MAEEFDLTSVKDEIKRHYEKNRCPMPPVIVCPSPTYMYNYATLITYDNIVSKQYKPRYRRGENNNRPLNISYNRNHTDFFITGERNRIYNEIINRCCYKDYNIAVEILKKDFNYTITKKSYDNFQQSSDRFAVNSIRGVYYIPFNHVCLISKPPVFLNVVDNQLHCTTDYAVYFEDKIGFHYVYGVFFDKATFERFFVTRTKESGLDGIQVLMHGNTEQKAAIIKHIGYTKLMEWIKEYKTIDREKSVSKLDGKDIFYEVIEVSIPVTGFRNNVTLRMVKVTDFSTDKIVFLGVPLIDQTKTCKGAIAWTFGIDTDKYNPIIET